jgi:2-polyprenyl-3-methyl-5-hydroxy-6-metoxy-1,4-benzoquinol methylase
MKNHKSLSTKTIVYCELCNDVSTLFKIKDTFQYFKCQKCSFVFLSPNPNEKEIKSLYSKSEYIYAKLESKHLQSIYRIVKITKNLRKTQSLLDIGCQNGDFLNELQKYTNFDLYGIEPSYEGAKNARSNKKLKIKRGYFHDGSYENSKFDIVNLGDVIEHLTEPKKMIDNIYKILKPGGLLIVTTPISNCPYVFLSNAVNRRIKSYPLAWLTPPFHIKYFSSKNCDEFLLRRKFIKVDDFFTSSNFFYELAETQIFYNFRRKNVLKKFTVLNIFHITIFCIIYLFSKIATIFISNKFSYTAYYRKEV